MRTTKSTQQLEIDASLACLSRCIDYIIDRAPVMTPASKAATIEGAVRLRQAIVDEDNTPKRRQGDWK